MCTAITFKTKDHYFGRNLDLEYHYQETVTITPRNFKFHFRKLPELNTHYALIGVATVAEGYPLYYDATNEKGLSMAGLNFPGNACYQLPREGAENIAPFELIPWILGKCATVSEALILINKLNLCSISFNKDYPLTPLHWLLADGSRSVTIEPLKEGLKIYDNLTGVLTNNPPFDYHIQNLNNYLNLTREEPENRLAPQLELRPFSRGMGAIGLPGDLSSPSRFIRAVFTKFNSVCQSTENESVSQLFHILGAVEQQNGCSRVVEKFEKTVYSSCCNTDRGIYYYRTYENSQISAVNMHLEELESAELIVYPLVTEQQINYINN